MDKTLVLNPTIARFLFFFLYDLKQKRRGGNLFWGKIYYKASFAQITAIMEKSRYTTPFGSILNIKNGKIQCKCKMF